MYTQRMLSNLNPSLQREDHHQDWAIGATNYKYL